MTLRMPVEGKLVLAFKNKDFPVIFSKTRMMESLMKLPDDIFNQEILQYLTLDNIVKLVNACMNHEYRPQLLEKLVGVILLGDLGDQNTIRGFNE
jgi:hypothetical protein